MEKWISYLNFIIFPNVGWMDASID